MKGSYKMSTAICIKDFKGVGFLKENNDESKKGYLWFKDVCFGHMDAYPGQYFKF